MATFGIVINAPAERVFEELSHVERHPLWANPKARMQMEQTLGEAPGTEARYRSSGIFVKSPVTADISVTAFDPPRVFAIRSDQHQEGKKDVWYANTFTLTPTEGGTRVEKSIDGNGNAFIEFIAYPAIKKDVMTSLTNLKRLVESGGAA